MMMKHEHAFKTRRKGSKIAFCDCGRFQFIGLKPAEIIECVPPAVPYQPKTGAACSCRRGIMRDNCAACEGTGMIIDFARIRARRMGDK